MGESRSESCDVLRSAIIGNISVSAEEMVKCVVDPHLSVALVVFRWCFAAGPPASRSSSGAGRMGVSMFNGNGCVHNGTLKRYQGRDSKHKKSRQRPQRLPSPSLECARRPFPGPNSTLQGSCSPTPTRSHAFYGNNLRESLLLSLQPYSTCRSPAPYIVVHSHIKTPEARGKRRAATRTWPTPSYPPKGNVT